MEPIKIAVTGLNASNNPCPGIGVARSLKESDDLDVKIAGLAYDAMEPGIYMDWFIDKAYLIPYPSAQGEALFERLLYIKATYGIDIAIPTLDSEYPFFMAYKDKLLEAGIKTILPDAEQFKLRDKTKLPELAKKAKIKSPRQEVVSNYQELSKAIEKIKLPVMIKGSLYNAYQAHTLEQAMGFFNKIVSEWGYPVIVQEIIVGDEMNVIGVGDGNGQALGLVAVKKMSTTELGKIWTGVTVQNEQLLAATRECIKNTKWNGAFEMECIVKDEQVYLIEMNPRFPAWVYFATGVGVNLPELLVKRMLGEQVDAITDYEPGKLYIRYTGEQVCDMHNFQDVVTKGETPNG